MDRDPTQVELERLRAENAALRAMIEDHRETRVVGEALASVGSRVGRLPNAELEIAVPEGLGVLAQAIGYERAFVVVFTRRGFERTHAWSAEGVPPPPAALRRDAVDRFRELGPPSLGRVVTRTTTPPGTADAALLEATGARSLLQFAVVSEGRQVGVIGFDSVREERALPPAVVGLLATTGDLFGSVVLRLRQDAEWRKLVDCLLGLGPSPRDNIQRLTALVGELLGGAGALYNRLEDGRLHTWGRWNLPEAMPDVADPDGHICAAVIGRGGAGPVVLRDLARSSFAASDPAVLAFGVASYVGRAIELEGKAVGALGVVYADDVEPTSSELRLLSAIANAVAGEEQRARAIAALVHSEEAARVVFEHSLDGILVSAAPAQGEAGAVRAANPAACTMLGYTEDELTGKTRFDLVADPVRLPAFLAERARVGRARGDITYRRKDGSTFTADVVSSSVVVPGGGARNIMILRDASERLRAAATLERSRALLAATLESTGDGILAVDADRRVVCHNKKFRAMWGIPDELASTTDESRLLAIVPALLVDPEGFVARVEALYADPNAEADDVVALADGRTFERYSIPLRIEGERAGRVWSFRDVTDRVRDKQREQELEQEMRQAQKMEAVGRLAGGIAHDFNNLLTVISGYAAFVRESLAEGDDLRGDIVEIEQAARRAATLTRQLLAFSRRQVLLPKVLDLNSVVEGMTGMLERLLGEDVDVRTALDESLWPVKADPGQLEQVLVNLAVNARDAMPKGGVLRIATQNVLLDHASPGPDGVPAGLYVRLDVGDTGVGMDEATRLRAFEPFFTTKDVGKGTGLGLSTVYGIVRQSGGTVEIESAPGEGAVFRILLPVVAERVEPAGAPSVPARRATGTETILLVEDEEPVRRVAQKALAAAGYTVLASRDGVEAIELLERREAPIDLLLTDVVMPRMGGVDLAEAVRRRQPGVRVLFVSGHVDVGGAGRAQPEATALLEKPFRPDVLLDRVRDVLDD